MESKEENYNYCIQPWDSQEEFIIFYETLFDIKTKSQNQIEKDSQNISNSSDNITNNYLNDNLNKFIQSLSLSNLKKAMIYLIKWDNRGDNKMFCLPIILLVNTIIKIKENNINDKDINSCHILAEVLIRVVNIIMDQLRKTKKANSLNMYLIAKDIGLPEFIIDIRHSSTHKNLPSFNELLFAIEYMFSWIKIKIIDPKYNYFIKEKKYFIFLLKELDSDNNINIYERENTIDKFKPINLEPEHLMTLITHLFVNIKKSFKFNKSKKKASYDINNNIIKHKLILFKKIFNKEKEVFILMIFSFVYQQILKVNTNEDISKEEKEKYISFILSFIIIIYNNVPKNIKFDLKKCEILYISLYNNINKLKNGKNKEYDSLLDLFVNTFKNCKKSVNLEKNILNENQGSLRKNVDYVDLDSIKGNINIINVENYEDEEDENENGNGGDINKKRIEDLKNDEDNNKMNIEENIDEILNKDECNNYNNYNTLIFE